MPLTLIEEELLKMGGYDLFLSLWTGGSEQVFPHLASAHSGSRWREDF